MSTAPKLRINKHDDEEFPAHLLPKKSQQKKGEEAVTARYESRKNICPKHFIAKRLIDGMCDECE